MTSGQASCTAKLCRISCVISLYTASRQLSSRGVAAVLVA